MARTKFFRIRPALLVRPGLNMSWRFIRYGGLVVCNETLWGIGTSVFPTIMGHMENSTEILAAYTLAGNVEKLCTVFSFGLAATASIIIGREIGAGRTGQVRRIGLAMDTLAVGCGLTLGCLLLCFARFVAPDWVFPLFKLSPAPRRWRHDAHRHVLLHAPAGLQQREHRGRPPGRRRRAGGHPHRHLPPVGVRHPLRRPVRSGAAHPVLWVYLAFMVEQVVKFGLGLWRLRSGRWIRDLTRA